MDETDSMLRVWFVEDMQLDFPVGAGASLGTLADLWEFLGHLGTDSEIIDPTSMFQRGIHSILSSMPDPTKPDDSLSALARAVMDDHSIAIEAIVDRVKQALKSADYREYAQTTKGRLLEWCALVDFDSSTSMIRQAAFAHLSPVMLKSGWGL